MQREDKLSGSLTAILNDMGIGTPPEVSPEQPIIPLHVAFDTDCLPLDAMQDIADQVLQDRDQRGHAGLAPATCRFEPRLQPTGPRHLAQ